MKLNPPKKPAHNKERVKKTKELNLLERFITSKEEILTFMHHKAVPFDNNIAERGFCIAKSKTRFPVLSRELVLQAELPMG